MRYLFQRIIHNERGWTEPSPGRLAFTGDGEYLEKHGFGYEDWNFRRDKCADGHIFGYSSGHSCLPFVGAFKPLFRFRD
jgi:hypothetical protein